MKCAEILTRTKMVETGSMQLSLELGACSIHWRSKPLQMTQHSWSANISKPIQRRGYTIPSRYRILKHQCFLNPYPSLDTSCLKNMTLAIERSYKNFQGNHLEEKLVMAVGIVIFAIWVLEPVVRQIRNIFLSKSSTGCKKSTTYHVTSSYIQPLILWAGAILVCRAIERLVLPNEAGHIVMQRLLKFGRSLSTLMAFAYCLSRLIQEAKKFMETNGTNDTTNMSVDFASRAIYTAVWVAAVSLFMELLGYSTQKWLTAGGVGTVLLTLAGREIFTNFLSSAMIHATRPFVLNEWIQIKIQGYEVSGTVEHVGWWSPTIIRADDREAVHIPNHKFTMNVVRNLSQKSHWRIKTHLAISHLDARKVNSVIADMRKVLAKNPQVEQQKLHRRVFLDDINPENQALLILVSCFVKTSRFEEYLCVKESIFLDLLRVIRHHRCRLAIPIRTVQKAYAAADSENIPYADANFNRRASADRSLLMIEPSYKINGEDKAKPPQGRSAQVDREQDIKITGSSATNGGDVKCEHSLSTSSTSESKVSANSSKIDILKDNVKPDAEVEHAPTTETQLPKVAAKYSLEPKLSNGASVKSEVASCSDGNTSPGQTQKTSNKNLPTVSQDGASDSSSEIPGAKTRGELSSSSQVEQKQVMQASSSKPSLEENIVLGVALDGSKSTLPIEDPKSFSVDSKELTVNHVENGSQEAKTDKNVPKWSSNTGSPSGDQPNPQG